MCTNSGFYFWKIGYHVSKLADLEQGKDFAIVELNGAASEPTHIYDLAFVFCMERTL
jgi:hypothetical protein